MRIKKLKKPLIYIIWMLLVIASILLTVFTSYNAITDYYDKQIEAANLTKKCLDAISLYNKERGMEQNPNDYEDSYLLGSSMKNLITTTIGSPNSKRTSLNPNFGALFVKMFNECHIKENDSIAVCMSSSFPALNIACLCALETMNLKSVVMSSIGASQMGANDIDFTFPEWVDYLYNLGYLSKRVDYVSYGGEYDTIEGFYDYTSSYTIEENEDRLLKIKNRLIDSGLNFIEIDDYKENIDERMKIYYKELDNIKLFINIGGNIIGLGRSESSKYYYSGIIKNNYLKRVTNYDKNNSGLIDRFAKNGVQVVSILNLETICENYKIVYNPESIPLVTGDDELYFNKKYYKSIPIITLIISGLILGYILYINIKEKKTTYLNNLTLK